MFNECYKCSDSFRNNEGEYIVVLTSEDDGIEVFMCYKCINKKEK